jgi:hypothetical protein
MEVGASDEEDATETRGAGISGGGGMSMLFAGDVDSISSLGLSVEVIET